MKAHLFVLVLLAVINIFSGCKKEQEPAKSVESRIDHLSDCKTFPSDSAVEMSSKSCVEYIYNVTRKELFLKHLNAGFNCCPGSLYCVAHYSGDTLYIEEFESGACNDSPEDDQAAIRTRTGFCL